MPEVNFKYAIKIYDDAEMETLVEDFLTDDFAVLVDLWKTGLEEYEGFWYEVLCNDYDQDYDKILSGVYDPGDIEILKEWVF